MSYIFVPPSEVFLKLPVSKREEVFSGGTAIHSRPDLKNIVAQLRDAAINVTKDIEPSFTPEKLKDFDDRPVIAVVADGATIHMTLRDETQRTAQEADSRVAFELGKEIASRGWRTALPGYNGLCKSIIEGVQSANGHYIVVTTKRSLSYDIDGAATLPQNGKHGLYIVTNSLAESKSALFALTDSSVYLRGGLNTLDIFTDHFVMEQTGMLKEYRLQGAHRRNLIMLNDDGFWDGIPKMTEHMVAQGFANEIHKQIVKITSSVSDTITMLESNLYAGSKWQEPDADQPWLFTPSSAITLAAELSRPTVMRQIKPATPANLLKKLETARHFAKKQDEIDPVISQAITQPTAAVYCGSRDGKNPKHLEAAKDVGELLRATGYTLIYGGSLFGLMGAVADGYLKSTDTTHKPHVLAVTPFPFLLGESTAANEGFHKGLTATIAVPGMQERKILMTSLSSGSPKAGGHTDITVMLSGGWGSLDELLEEIRLSQMGVTHKKIVILNVDNYWKDFSGLFEKAIQRGYMDKQDMAKVSIIESVGELRNILLAGKPAKAPLSQPQPI